MQLFYDKKITFVNPGPLPDRVAMSYMKRQERVKQCPEILQTSRRKVDRTVAVCKFNIIDFTATLDGTKLDTKLHLKFPLRAIYTAIFSVNRGFQNVVCCA
jgi:hypothetical protein